MGVLAVLLVVFTAIGIIGAVFFVQGILNSNEPELIFGFLLMAFGLVADIISLLSKWSGLWPLKRIKSKNSAR